MNCIGLRKSLPFRAAALLCTAAAVLSAAALPLCSAADVDAGDTPEERAAAVTAVADGIIEWKKLDNGSSADGYLINETYLELAGSTPGDWYQIGLSRLGVEDNYAGYLAVIRDRVEERYRDPGKLSAASHSAFRTCLWRRSESTRNGRERRAD